MIFEAARPAVSPRIEARRSQAIEQILDAAWTLAAEHGIAGFSMAQLAARVGMRAPSLYSYFSSKAAIYDALFAAGNAELRRRTDALTRVEDARAGLIAIADVLVAFAAEDPARYSLLFARPIPGWEPSPEAYTFATALYEDGRRWMHALGLAEQWHYDLWTGMVSGLMAQQVANDPGGDRWARLVPHAVEAFLGHVRPLPT